MIQAQLVAEVDSECPRLFAPAMVVLEAELACPVMLTDAVANRNEAFRCQVWFFVSCHPNLVSSWYPIPKLRPAPCLDEKKGMRAIVATKSCFLLLAHPSVIV